MGDCDARLDTMIIVLWWGGINVVDRAWAATHAQMVEYALRERLLCYTSCVKGYIILLVMGRRCGLQPGWCWYRPLNPLLHTDSTSV